MKNNPRLQLNFLLKYSQAGGKGCFGYFPSYRKIARMYSEELVNIESIFPPNFMRKIGPYVSCIPCIVLCKLRMWGLFNNSNLFSIKKNSLLWIPNIYDVIQWSQDFVMLRAGNAFERGIC